MKYRFTFLLLTFILGIFPLFLTAQVNPQDVTISRDQWGVPHIHGKTDADAAELWDYLIDKLKEIVGS